MGLSRSRIGDLIALVDERNTDGSITAFFGININKEFMPTVANTVDVNSRKYKVVRNHRFVFSGMQTGRDECIRIGLYQNDDPMLVSPAYTTFEISNTDLILEEYFFMLFLRKEMDRYGWFISDSSIRSNLDWDRFCDITLDLPPLPIQRKYIEVYKAMLANQQAYERGLDDLKLICDTYIERLRHELPGVEIGPYIKPGEAKNEALKYGVDDVRGISIEKRFIDTRANMDGVSLRPYLLVEPDAFAYVTVTSRNGEKISIAHNDSNNTHICSSSYIVFMIAEKDKLIPSYLSIFFSRSEFDRYSRFHSWGSARETFGWEDMCGVKIPIPDITVQRAIVNIHKSYLTRREINEKLKSVIKDVCPILIKGSLEEAKRK